MVSFKKMGTIVALGTCTKYTMELNHVERRCVIQRG
jgi:hypothetical protein